MTKLIQRCSGVAIRRKRPVHEEAAHSEEEKGNSDRVAISCSGCLAAAAAVAGAGERTRRWTGWGIARVHLDPHDGKLHSTRETLLCAREGLWARAGKQTWRAISGMASGAGLLSMPSEDSGIANLVF